MEITKDPELQLETILDGLEREHNLRPLRDYFLLLLSDPSIIESEGLPDIFDINVNGYFVTRLLGSGIAFGILWEQEENENNSEFERTFIAPFGFYSTDDIIDAQGEPDAEGAFRFIKHNRKNWVHGAIHPESLYHETGMKKGVGFTLMQSIGFGQLLERVNFEEVRRSPEVKEEILQKYEPPEK